MLVARVKACRIRPLRFGSQPYQPACAMLIAHRQGRAHMLLPTAVADPKTPSKIDACCQDNTQRSRCRCG